MRHYFHFFFLLVTLIAGALSAEKQEEPPYKNAPVPAPLELDKDFWVYFETPAGELPQRIERFKDEIEARVANLSEKEHEEIIGKIDDVLLNLSLLVQLKQEIAPQNPPKLQLLKDYTLSELLDVNQRLLETQNELSRVKDKADSQKSKMNRVQTELDKEILYYQNLPGSSYERLYTGLNIIDLRSEIAIQSTKLDRTKQKQGYLQKEKELLADELKIAKTNLFYREQSREEYVQDLKHSRLEIEKASIRLKELEKEELTKNSTEIKGQLFCCLWEYQVLTESIRIEKWRIQALIEEIKLALYDIAHSESEEEFANLKPTIKGWEKTLASGKELINQWQKQLKNEHGKISRIISAQLKEEPEKDLAQEKVISDIHLELDKSFALLDPLQIKIDNAHLLIKLVQSRFAEEMSITETWAVKADSYWSSTIEGVNDRLGVTIFRVKDYPVTVGTLLKAFLTILFAFFLSRYVRHVLSTRLLIGRRTFSNSTKFIILRLTHYAIMIIAAMVALSMIGLDFTNLAIIAGALGVGIGFGLQSMVNNIISGFMLLLNRYLKVGDVVETEGGIYSSVKAINLQYTHIKTFDGADIIIPNSQLSTRGLTNWTMRDNYRRFRVPFGVAYGSDKEKLKEKLVEAVKKLPYVVTSASSYPDPQIWFTNFGDSSMDFELVAWVDLTIQAPYGTAKSSLLWEIDNVLNEHAFDIPFPQRDLYVKEFPKGSQ